jgi:hypothetical protein
MRPTAVQSRIIGIHRAIVDNDEASFKQLLDSERLCTASLAANGRSPLHTAVLNERWNIVNYLTMHYPSTADCVDNVRMFALD